MIEIVEQPIDEQRILESVKSEDCGAAVLFVGTTRRFTDDVETVLLEYEAYREMALLELSKIRDQAFSRWPIARCSMVHRLGPVAIGETSIAVAVGSCHRADAFSAAAWLMDRIKESVPIWKRELGTSGRVEWVHPGFDSKSESKG
jgi:molybdopterin synthase catalytic subunit